MAPTTTFTATSSITEPTALLNSWQKLGQSLTLATNGSRIPRSAFHFPAPVRKNMVQKNCLYLGFDFILSRKILTVCREKITLSDCKTNFKNLSWSTQMTYFGLLQKILICNFLWVWSWAVTNVTPETLFLSLKSHIFTTMSKLSCKVTFKSKTDYIYITSPRLYKKKKHTCTFTYRMHVYERPHCILLVCSHGLLAHFFHACRHDLWNCKLGHIEQIYQHSQRL